ncbi:MAG: zinc transporter ZntB [Gammaproteobacteria bacterium]
MNDGLIHALLINGSTVVVLDRNGVQRWRPDQGLLWLHLDWTAADVRTWLHQLPETAVAALLAEETRPRAGTNNDSLILNLRGVNLNPGANPEDMVSLRLWADAGQLITTRHRRLLSVEDVVNSLEERPFDGPGDLLVRLADALVVRINDVVDDLEDDVAKLEDSVMREPDRAMRAQLSELRRNAIALRRYLAPQREAMSRLQGEKLSWLTDIDRLRLREIGDRLIRYLEDLDALRERAAVVQEELMGLLSDQINKRAYVLSVVAAIFLPLGFLTGLLGINVGGIPGAESAEGFLIFSLMLVAVVALQLWYFKKKRWF